MSDFETTMAEFAAHIFAKAQAEKCDIQDGIKAFEALTKYYAILTKDGDKGDKSPKDGRRPTTFAEMRKRIALVKDHEGAEDEPD